MEIYKLNKTNENILKPRDGILKGTLWDTESGVGTEPQALT